MVKVNSSSVNTPATPVKANVPTTGKKGKAKKEVTREVKHSKFNSQDYLASNNNGPIRVALAKLLMGWEDEESHKARVLEATPNMDISKISFPSEHMFVDQRGLKVRCTNNTHNRPFDESHALSLAQDMLHKNWADTRNGEDMSPNGESIIIGRTGLVLSGQHRLIGLILADQIINGHGQGDGQKAYWQSIWGKEEISIEGVITYGASENPRVVRTLDNVKPRTFADVLFTDPTITGNLSAEKRQIFARSTDYGIKFLWERTGEKQDAYAPRRTHSEAMEFLLNHPKLKDCVKWIMDVNGGTGEEGRKIAKWMSLGDVAGVMYLMAASSSDGDVYWNSDTRKEGGKNGAKLDNYDHAKEFWGRFANHDDFAPIRDAFRLLADAEAGTTGGNKSQKLAILCHCWKRYLEGEAFAPEDLTCATKYSETAEKNVVNEWPDFGGIDKGPKKPKPPSSKPLSETDIDAELAAAQAEGGDEEEGEEEPENQEEANAVHANRIAELQKSKLESIEEHNRLTEEKLASEKTDEEEDGLEGWESSPGPYETGEEVTDPDAKEAIEKPRRIKRK